MSPILLMTMMMVFVLLMIILMFASRYVKVPPNKAMVLYGHKFKGQEGMMILTGGGKFIVPLIESWEWLDLEVKTLNIKVIDIITKDHHMVNVDCVAQSQIDPSEDSLKTAAVMLLRKTPIEIDYITQKTLEGHIRGVCATLPVLELHEDMEKAAICIGTTANQDLMSMGLNVVSFVIHNVSVTDDGADGTGNPTQATLLRAQVELLESRVAELEAKLGINDTDPPPPPPPLNE